MKLRGKVKRDFALLFVQKKIGQAYINIDCEEDGKNLIVICTGSVKLDPMGTKVFEGLSIVNEYSPKMTGDYCRAWAADEFVPFLGEIKLTWS